MLLGDLIEINRLQEENDRLHKQIVQMRYNRTVKGKAKQERENEKKRNKTLYKKLHRNVINQIESINKLYTELSDNFINKRYLQFI